MRTGAKIEEANRPRVVVGRLQPAKREKRTVGRRTEVDTSDRPSRAALKLALAHHIERAIDAGQIRDQADAAQQLGLTRARVTQILNLLLLTPGTQEAILSGANNSAERSLRALVSRSAEGKPLKVPELS